MPVYTYRCRNCDLTGDALRQLGDISLPPCPECGEPMSRVFTSFGFQRSMPEHFNKTTGTYISNNRQFKDELKRKSEEMTARLGIEHNYQPVDPADAREVYGVTDEGMDATHRRRREKGLTEAKLWL